MKRFQKRGRGMERSYADHVKKNHIAKSNEGTGVFFFFFFRNFGRDILSLTDVFCRNIVCMQR